MGVFSSVTYRLTQANVIRYIIHGLDDLCVNFSLSLSIYIVTNDMLIVKFSLRLTIRLDIGRIP